MDILFGMIAIIIVAGLAGGTLWLSNAHIQPETQQTRLALPDERIPH